MEQCSQDRSFLSASAQRILAALRAQYADKLAKSGQGEKGGGGLLRQSNEERSWRRAQESSATGDQEGLARAWASGHVSPPRGANYWPYLEVTSGSTPAREGLSTPLQGYTPDPKWDGRNGGGDPAFGIHFSLQASPEDALGIWGPDQAEIHDVGASLQKEEGVRRLALPWADITTVRGPQAEGLGVGKGLHRRTIQEEAQGDQVAHIQKGVRGGQWKFRGLLLPLWSPMPKEVTQLGRGKEEAGSERGPPESLVEKEGEGRSYSGRILPGLLGDGVIEGGEWAVGCSETLQSGGLMQPVKNSVIEEEEARRCRTGVLSGVGAGVASVQAGFQLTPSHWQEAGASETEPVRRSSAWTGPEPDNQGMICRMRERKSQIRNAGQGEDQAGWYSQELAGENQMLGYRENQVVTYREELKGSYRENQAGVFNENWVLGYRGKLEGSCRENPMVSCREGSGKNGHSEKRNGRKILLVHKAQESHGHTGNTGNHRERASPDEAREVPQINRTGNDEKSTQLSTRGWEPSMHLSLLTSCQTGAHSMLPVTTSIQTCTATATPTATYTCTQIHTHPPFSTQSHNHTTISNQTLIYNPISNQKHTHTPITTQSHTPVSSHILTPTPTPIPISTQTPISTQKHTHDPTYTPSSLSRLDYGSAQETTSQVTHLKRRPTSPLPNHPATKRLLRWEPPRPSQGPHMAGGASEGGREAPQIPPHPPKVSQATLACIEGLTRPEPSRVMAQTHNPPNRKEYGEDPREQVELEGAGAKIPKLLKRSQAGHNGQEQEGHSQEAQIPEAGRESSTSLTSDPMVRDACRLSSEERACKLQEAGRAPALVLTLVYQDGSTQLSPKQKYCPSVSGILLLLKAGLDVTTLEEEDSLVYLKLEQRPAWAQQEPDQNQDLFTREMVLLVLTSPKLVVCYKAKDLLRTLLQHYKRDLCWKQVAQCRILDPQIAAWLLDPADSASCFQNLLTKHGITRAQSPTQPIDPGKSSPISTSLSQLYQLMMKLQSNLQSQGLWDLFSTMELSMIPVLAAMESYHIYVDKEALKRTSEILGMKLKQLEQEAHKAAGQQFLVSSSAQLRLVLFEKLRLHERCENRRLPKTMLKQQQSTSEAALLQLQDLHPLPKIILEYRQVHKIKSTFIDGILSCMKNMYISSTWNQTSAVSGRLSAKQPNFQALPKQPVQISKKQYIQGKEAELVMVHPRDMFMARDGWTFIAADFSQVELRLLAHLTSDPELLKLFHDPAADVFTMLASQWKGVPEERLKPEDREHAKRIVYSVIYGAGRERLSGILGVSTEQASRFVDSFLQRYREVQNFIQRTVHQCQKQGYVVSIMGRQRSLPHIRAADWSLRNQAERQAVNFVVQGSAADLCKMAMIRIFSLVSSSSTLTARLLAQIHDELLFEVEDSQVEDFAAMVKTTMESLQHIDSLGVHLKVPLKVVVSSGQSWGSMSELHLPPNTKPPPPSP